MVIFGAGIESRWGRDFTYPSIPALRDPSNLLYNGVPGLFPGVKWSGRGVNHPPPSSAEVKEIVDLYLYTLSGPSWPVLVRTSAVCVVILRSHIDF